MRAALRLADAGCHVFPCEPGGKRPVSKHGFHDATRDRGRVRNWWAAGPTRNIGIACEVSRLAVVDLDGDEGIDAWRRLCAEHPGTPVTLTARTPSGGRHLYFLADPARPLRSTAGQLAGHVDTRGRGGYVIAPPSRRPDGRYRWHSVPDIDRLPVVPGGSGSQQRPSPPGRAPPAGCRARFVCAPTRQRGRGDARGPEWWGWRRLRRLRPQRPRVCPTGSVRLDRQRARRLHTLPGQVGPVVGGPDQRRQVFPPALRGRREHPDPLVM